MIGRVAYSGHVKQAVWLVLTLALLVGVLLLIGRGCQANQARDDAITDMERIQEELRNPDAR